MNSVKTPHKSDRQPNFITHYSGFIANFLLVQMGGLGQFLLLTTVNYTWRCAFSGPLALRGAKNGDFRIHFLIRSGKGNAINGHVNKRDRLVDPIKETPLWNQSGK